MIATVSDGFDLRCVCTASGRTLMRESVEVLYSIFKARSAKVVKMNPPSVKPRAIIIYNNYPSLSSIDRGP